MIYLELYLTFLKIGLLAFGGGFATIPLINQFLVIENSWLTAEQMLDVISISQMAPGAIAINSATFVGTKIAGIPGMFSAAIGVITPQILIILILLKVIGINNPIIKKMIDGINAGIVALIFLTALSLTKSAVKFDDFFSIFLFIIGLILYKTGFGVIKTLSLGAVIGVIKVLCLR